MKKNFKINAELPTKTTEVSYETTATETQVELPEVQQKVYQRGDEFEFKGQQVRVVELIEDNRLHVKNKNEPFNSFIVLTSEIEQDAKEPAEDVKQLTKALDEAISTFGKERFARAIVEASKDSTE